MKYRGTSLRPFRLRQILNRCAPPLQRCLSLFAPFLCPLYRFFLLRGRYPRWGEYIGFTVFRVVNSANALGAIYEPGVLRPFTAELMKPRPSASVPFWFKRLSPFRLLMGDDPYNDSLTLSIAFLSLRFICLGLADYPRCHVSFPLGRYHPRRSH